MNIGQEIVQELLEQASKNIAIFGGGFKPPTKGHFEVAKLALERHPYLDELIISVGTGIRNGVTQEQSVAIWEIYKNYLPDSSKVTIMASPSSPIRDAKKLAENNPEDNIIWILGTREGNAEDEKDVISRTADVDKYPNLTVDVISTAGEVSGTKARQALNISKEDFFKFLPDEIKDEKEGVYNILTKTQTQERFVPGPLLHELFEKDLPNIEKVSPTEYIVGNGNDIEAKYYFRLVVPEDKAWSVSWKFTDNNKNTSPEAWKQITATSYKIIADFLEKFNPTSLHISGNSDTKTNVYKRYADRLQTILNNKYRVDNSEESEVVLRSIEEVAKSGIKKRMETLDESYDQALNYWKNGDIFSKSKIERNDTIKKYNSRKQLSELYNIPFKTNILLETFTPQKAPLMGRFVDYACDRLNIDKPKVFIINSPTYSQEHKSFGGYYPQEQKINVVVHNRNMADILRTLAHELVHHMQNLNGDELNGEDGSDTENEANAMAGVIMREFGRENPEIFESKLDEAIVGDRIECDNCGWSWPIADGGDDLFICHKCGHDNTEEYDVENEQDLKEFISFLKEYTKQLSESTLTEAEYHGHKVTLGKIMQGDIKKFKVYVKNNKGKVVKVNFGFGGSSAHGKRMNIKVHNPKRRAAYRARHNCANPGPRWKANYWSCKKW